MQGEAALGTLPQLVPFQVPNVNLGDTFTQMARLSAYEQSRRTSALEEEEKRGKLDRDRLWRSTIAGAFPTTDPRAPAGLNAPPPQAQAGPQMPAQAPPVTGGLAGPQMISQGPSTMGPTGMASQVPVNQAMDVNPQTGEWSTPGGLSAPPTSPMAPGGLTQPPPGMPSAITALAQPAAPGQPPLQGGGFSLAQPQNAPTGQPGASAGTLGGPQPQRPLQASVPGLMPMPDMKAVQQAFAIDPEKTSTWYSAYLTQRGKQLEEVDRNNKLVYQVTGAMLENPQYYGEGLEYLRDQGVPVPKNMPQTFNPALVKFHHDVSRQRLDPLQEAQRENQLAQAALHREQGLTEASTRGAVERFRAGEGGQPGAAAGGTQATGTAQPGARQAAAPAEVETAVQEAVKLYPQVRPDLVRAIIAQESNFDAKAVSPKGAQGYMQLMPGTAKEMGVDDPFDTTQNIRGGVRYFAQLLSKYGGDEAKALAAYNAGPGRVDAAKGDLKALPQETQDYVPKVLQRAQGGAAASTPAGTTAASTGPRIAQLRQEIAAKQRRATEAANIGTPLAGAATQLRSEITDLQQELARLEEPQRELAKQQILQKGKIEEAQAAELAKAAPQEMIDAINRSRPADQKIPYGTKLSALLEKGIVGGERVPQPVLDDLANRSVVIQQLDELSTNFGALPTGPIAGRLDAIKQRFGIDVTDEKVAYRQILATTLNQLLQARSGAAINEHEYQRIKGELPDPDDPQPVFKAKLATATRLAKNFYRTKARTYREAGHALSDTLMEPLAAPETPPPATPTTSNVDRFRDAVRR
jgi:Transglycosylase SLT domain